MQPHGVPHFSFDRIICCFTDKIIFLRASQPLESKAILVYIKVQQVSITVTETFGE